ncbi:Ca2+ regulator and membrane fusion protein Fig1-domain-containing protein [Ilyonectria robusta]|uniref:Ca2+ regulator and membrane fusion protein Fig1-domain-containing protein n=1 Tax=Ilyonectria robusta TaxID=1079257 RepID=UPI001E8CEAAF|nr:Ca2+ regulator and membrane fusion protein Fig1-domain-containing protein [Ilyonectria robusta]KAH8667234.1 Ca2+ regulator and membrane fusion protein Fig1-domain-containing protein [Ilyonectria robusta]
MAATSGNPSDSSSSESRHYPHRVGILQVLTSKINLLQEFSFVVALVPLSTLLAGCAISAPSLRDIYILSLSYNTNSRTLQTSSVNETLYGAFTNPLNDTSKIVEVRVAYFALCVLTSARNWICDSNASNLAQSLRADNQTDPLNLLWIGEKFQSEAITSAFMFVTIILVLAAVIMGILYPPNQEQWAEGGSWATRFLNHSQRHSHAVGVLSVSRLLVGSFAALTAAIWQHLAGASASLATDLTFGAVKYQTGTAALALGWLSFLLVACGFLLTLMGALFHSDSPVGWELPSELTSTDSDASEVDSSPGDNVEGQQRHQTMPLYNTQNIPPMAQHVNQAALNRMFYFAGQQRSTAYPPRYYDTAVRVDRWRQQTNVPRGYAETISDESYDA